MTQTNKESITSYQELLTRKGAVEKGLVKINFIVEQIGAGTFNPGRSGQFSRERIQSLSFEDRVDAGVRMGEINRRLKESARPTLQASEGALTALQDRVQGIIDLVAHGHLPQSFLDDIFAENSKTPTVVVEEPIRQEDGKQDRGDHRLQALEKARETHQENTRQRILALDRIVMTVVDPQTPRAIDKAELTKIGIATARMKNVVGALQDESEREAWVQRQIVLTNQGFLGALLERFAAGTAFETDQQFIAHVESVMKQRSIETGDVKVAVDYFKSVILPQWHALQSGKSKAEDVKEIVESAGTSEKPGRRDVLFGKLEEYGNQRAELLLRILHGEPVTKEEITDTVYTTSVQPLRYKDAVDEPLLRWEVARGVIEGNHADAFLPAMAKRYVEGKAPAMQQVFMSELIKHMQTRIGGEVTPYHAVSLFRREIFTPLADKISSANAVETVDELLMEMERVTEEYEQIYGERLMLE